ncbi:hypothetical protein C6B42_20565 [Aeromonas caviae]|nr:hypothetical protein C6B42_20565 [Aeromonas caviae]
MIGEHHFFFRYQIIMSFVMVGLEQSYQTLMKMMRNNNLYSSYPISIQISFNMRLDINEALSIINKEAVRLA